LSIASRQGLLVVLVAAKLKLSWRWW